MEPLGFQDIRLKSAHLAAGRGCQFFNGAAANNLPHGWIHPQTLGIVGVFITRQPSKYGLAQQGRHRMPDIQSSPIILKNGSSQAGQS